MRVNHVEKSRQDQGQCGKSRARIYFVLGLIGDQAFEDALFSAARA